MTKPRWLDLSMPLGQGKDDLVLRADGPVPEQRHLGQLAGDAAVERLAETLIGGTRLVNAPLYRLLNADVSPSGLRGSVGITSFVEYALTLDLLENELADAISQGGSATLGALPLRDHYLPNLAALTGLHDRICVGGPVALTAIARPHSRWRRTPPDYVLLVQERSAHVLNAAHRLAVIPKAFHQPLVRQHPFRA